MMCRCREEGNGIAPKGWCSDVCATACLGTEPGAAMATRRPFVPTSAPVAALGSGPKSGPGNVLGNGRAAELEGWQPWSVSWPA